MAVIVMALVLVLVVPKVVVTMNSLGGDSKNGGVCGGDLNGVGVGDNDGVGGGGLECRGDS